MKHCGYMIAFPNIFSAIVSERILADSRIHTCLAPVPTAMRAGCNISLSLTGEDFDIARRLITENGVETEGFYVVDSSSCHRVF